MPVGEGDSYEMVGTQDWKKEGDPESSGDHAYALPTLDADWFPVLAARLHGGRPDQGVSPVGDGQDETDFALRRGRRSRAEALDDIDGRGTFDAREVELELRTMHRAELEDQLGEILLWSFELFQGRSAIGENG